MAIDTHIKFDGIEGESVSRDHKGEVEVLAWNWGLTVTGGTSARARAKPVPQELLVVHRYDKASPQLLKFAAQGKRLPSALLTARKSGEGQKDFLKVTMKEVFITSITPTADGENLTEAVALRFSAIAFSYRPTDERGGLGKEETATWDVKGGKVS